MQVSNLQATDSTLNWELLVDLYFGVFVLTPMMPIVPELAREIERTRQETGLSLEELLDGLREQREQYYQEHYGDEGA